MYWLYWESPNNRCPRNVALLLRLFRKKLRNLIVVTDSTIHKYITVVDTGHLQHIAQRADYYRAKLLYTHGGVWLDIDTIMLADIDYLYRGLLESDKEACISVSELEENNVCLQYLIAKPKSRVFRLWCTEIERYLSRRAAVSYAFFGNLLAEIINRTPGLADTIIPFPNEITFRFGCKHVPKYYATDRDFIDRNMAHIIDGKKRMIILYGSGGFYDREIPKGTMLHRMLKHAHQGSPSPGAQ